MISCPSCGRGLSPDDAFCSQCGTRVGGESSSSGITRRTMLRRTIPPTERVACGSCNSPLLDGEVFCPVCGARSSQETPEGSPAWAPDFQKLEKVTRGRFEFLRELGRGGMGRVYLARELDLDRLVAIKALSSNWLTDEAMVERFRREARVIASLRHPSIVHVHGVGNAEDIHYFVMDYIDGVSLGSILQTHGPMSLRTINGLLFQVGSALSYAHHPSRGVIHRDVKPSNIMVDGEGNAFVTDFGISKVTQAKSGLTVTGVIMGTPEYMSPEQCRGDTATAASDQYALGVVLYAMLTGSPPFTGPSYRVLTGHTQETLPPVQDLRPDCPQELAEALDRMLSKEPGQRWPDIKDVLKTAGAHPLLPDDPAREEIVQYVDWTRRQQIADGSGNSPQASSDTPAGERTPTTLRIVAPQQSLEPGDEITLRATALFDDGQEIEGEGVEWRSTDPNVARVDSNTGDLVAVGAGSTVITARSGVVSESIAVEVVPTGVAQLVLEPDWLELEIGAAGRLTSKATDRRGDSIDQTIIWSSSDPSVATVSDQGEVRGHRLGSVTIMAHCQGVGATAGVTVIPATVASIEIKGLPNSMEVGDVTTLDAGVWDGQGEELRRPVFWSSSDSNVAKVSEDGLLTALDTGSTEIQAECGGQRSSGTVRVKPSYAPSSGTKSPPEASSPEAREPGRPASHPPRVPSGSQASPPSAQPSPSRRKAVVWSVLAVLAVLSGGLWFVWPRASLAPPDTGTEALSTDGIRELAISTRDGSPAVPVLDLVAGDTLTLMASGTSHDGNPVPSPAVTWRSTNPALATVSSDGTVVAHAAGSLAILATVDDIVQEISVAVAEPVAVTPETSEPTTAAAPLQEPVEAPAEQEPSAEARDEGPPPDPEPIPLPGHLLLQIGPRGARIVVDDEVQEENSRSLELSLPPGPHTLRIQIPGFVPVDTVVEIVSGDTTALRKHLQKIGNQ